MGLIFVMKLRINYLVLLHEACELFIYSKTSGVNVYTHTHTNKKNEKYCMGKSNNYDLLKENSTYGPVKLNKLGTFLKAYKPPNNPIGWPLTRSPLIVEKAKNVSSPITPLALWFSPTYACIFSVHSVHAIAKQPNCYNSHTLLVLPKPLNEKHIISYGPWYYLDLCDS